MYIKKAKALFHETLLIIVRKHLKFNEESLFFL